MPLKVYRYAACGAINVFLDIFTFYVAYHLILNEQPINIGNFIFKAHTTAFILSFFITFPVGFLLSKYIVWEESNIEINIQLFRYFVMVISNIFINIVSLKLFIEVFGMNALIAKGITICIVICVSYLNQKYYAFQVKEIS